MPDILQPLRGKNGKVSFGRSASAWMIAIASETVLFAQVVLLYALRSDHWTEATAFLEVVKIPAAAIFSTQLLVALAPYIVAKLTDKKAPE